MAAGAAAGGASAVGAGATTAGGIMAGTLGGMIESGISFGMNAASTSKAHDRQKNMMTRGPTYIMEGLRAAGINPILAAGSAGLGGASARAPQAGSATVGGFSRNAQMASQIRLQDAATAKAAAETSIIAAGQPAADWNAAFNMTGDGQNLLEAQRYNQSTPNTWVGAAARLLFKASNEARKGNILPPPGHKPIFGSPRPHSAEDNK